MLSAFTYINNIIICTTLFTISVRSFMINTNKNIINLQPQQYPTFTTTNKILYSSPKDDSSDSIENSKNENEKYKNVATQLLSNFLPKEESSSTIVNDKDKNDPFDSIDFKAPKIKKKSLEDLAAILDYELYEKEWFVTGKVNPIFFSDEFQFQDPDVTINGIEDYAKGVFKLFDQASSRAEIISTVVNTTVPDTITVTWRLSGKVSIGPGLTIKPYIVYTDFLVDSESLIISQEDRFSLPGWDILLSCFFPFLIGKVTAPPAPEVQHRVVPMPSDSGKNNFLSKFLDNFLPQNN